MKADCSSRAPPSPSKTAGLAREEMVPKAPARLKQFKRWPIENLDIATGRPGVFPSRLQYYSDP